MVVALGALNLQAEEHAADAAGCQGSFFFVDFVGQEVHGAVEVLGARLGAAGGGNEFQHHTVVTAVACERISQVLHHPVAVGQRIAFGTTCAADEEVAPDRRPVTGILFDIAIIVEQFAHDIRFALGRLIRVELPQLFGGRSATDQIQKYATQPDGVGCFGARGDLKILPGGFQRLIDQLDLWQLTRFGSRCGGRRQHCKRSRGNREQAASGACRKLAVVT